MDSGLYLILNPDLTIAEASDGYVRTTLLWNEAFLGRGMFDVFPDNPDDDGADGVKNLGASLRQVLLTGATDEMPIQRYDMRDRVSGDGHWVERYWLLVNTPLFGSGGTEVTQLLHQVEDVTDAVLLRDWIRDEQRSLAEQRASLGEMRRALMQRKHALRDADGALRAQGMRGTIDALRTRIGAPRAARYFDIGEIASVRGLYHMYHRRPCRHAPEQVFLRASSPFPACPHCADPVVFCLAKRVDGLC